MIKSVNNYYIEDLIKKDANFYYSIPKYQREYTWGPQQWKDIYDDILENDLGYFIGSIICINNTNDVCNVQELEIVDGQQRLTTLTLLLVAIYNKLKANRDKLNDDNVDEITFLRKSINCKGSPNGLILVPQIQNYNYDDYLLVMAENDLVKTAKKVKNWGNRRIAKCYRYFLFRLERDMEEAGEKAIDILLEIRNKVSKAVLVKIEVGSHSEAYTLFESLNNRGTPLTAIDLMKNSILAKAEKVNLSCDDCFKMWQTLLDYLSDDYGIQERFFRQYYNAFKTTINAKFSNPGDKKKDTLGYVATRSNLLSIYERIFDYDLQSYLEEILECGRIYSMFLLRNEEDLRFNKELAALYRIQGAPSYMLLLYVIRRQETLKIQDELIAKIIRLLTSFFVRRNLTDIPNTYELTRIFMTIIEEIEEKALQGNSVYDLIYKTLVSKSASDELFREKLAGNIYEDNTYVARFILCALAEKYMTKETFVDLWDQNDYKGKKVYKWTIEHIFPEGKNIPKEWVDMIAGGNKRLAEDYLEGYVHKLGNLTITGYNSALSNMSFVNKRDRKNEHNKYVGYKNGLEINKEIAEKDKWTIDDIIDRTERLVNEVIEMFSLE